VDLQPLIACAPSASGENRGPMDSQRSATLPDGISGTGREAGSCPFGVRQSMDWPQRFRICCRAPQTCPEKRAEAGCHSGGSASRPLHSTKPVKGGSLAPCSPSDTAIQNFSPDRCSMRIVFFRADDRDLIVVPAAVTSAHRLPVAGKTTLPQPHSQQPVRCVAVLY